MKNIFSHRNLRFVVIAFSVFGMFCFGKEIFYFFFPKQEVVVPIKMMEEFDKNFNESTLELRSEIEYVNNRLLYRMSVDPGKAKKWLMISDTVSIVLDSLITQTEKLKGTLNNISVKKLKSEIDFSKTKILNLFDEPSFKKEMERNFPLFQSFDSMINFHYQILNNNISSKLFFEMIINKILLTQIKIKNYCWVNATPSDGPINKMMARVFSERNIIHQNEIFMSNIFISNWYDFITAPRIIIGKLNSKIKRDSEGFGDFYPINENPVINGRDIEVTESIGKFSELNKTIGIHKYSGAVELINPDGTPIYYPFEAEYEVISKTPK